MKKLTLSVFFAFVCLSLSAQFRFGFGVGFNGFQTKLDHGDSTEIVLKPIYNVSGHLLVNYGLGQGYSLSSGINFVQKGAQENLNYGEEKWRRGDPNSVIKVLPKSYNKLHITYLEIPLKLEKKLGDISFFAGGYFGIALSGRQFYNIEVVENDYGLDRYRNYAGDNDVDPINGPIKDNSTELYCKRYDAGLQFGISCPLSHVFFISAEYSQGLINTIPKLSLNSQVYSPVHKEYNRGISLKLFFLFNGENQ